MPSVHRELELKFRTTPAGLRIALTSELLAPVSRPRRARILSSTYFDAEDRVLAKRGIVLRVRLAGRSDPVMTLKRKATGSEGPFAREEIEVRLQSTSPDVSLFEPTLAKELTKLLRDRSLLPQVETRFRRVTRLLHVGDSMIEVAFDHGFILAGDRRMKLNEIELELKSGNPADLYDLGRQVACRLPLRLETTSKAEAAFAFARNKAAETMKTDSICYPRDAPLDDAFAAVFLNTLDHFIGNWAALREAQTPESVHQMRVALRRMRAALGIMKAITASDGIEPIREKAKEIATALGPARQCDVFRSLIDHGPKSWADDKSTFTGLENVLDRETARNYRNAVTLIESPDVAIFALDVQSFVVRRGWREVAAVSGSTLPTGRQVAKQTLDRLYKRVRKAGDRLADLPNAERHEMRVKLKKLRYAAEFFSPYFDDERAAITFDRAAAELQEILGAHNDVVDAIAFLESLDRDIARRHAKAAGLMLGWYGRNEAFAEEKLAKAWRKFRKVNAFWR